MNDLENNLANEVRQYILDVLAGKQNTDDKCLGNFAKAARTYRELVNREDEISIEELETIEKYLKRARKNTNCGLGKIIDSSISQLEEAVEKLKYRIKKQ